MNRPRDADAAEDEEDEDEEEGDRYHDHVTNEVTGKNGGKKQERLLMRQHYYTTSTHHPPRLPLVRPPPQHQQQHQDDVEEVEDDDDDTASQEEISEKGDDKSDEEECCCLQISRRRRTRSNNEEEISVPCQHQEKHQQQDDEHQPHEQQEEEISSSRIRPPHSIVIPSLLANDSLKIYEEDSFDNLRSPFFHQRQEEEDLSITDEPHRGENGVMEVNADDRTSKDYILMGKCSKYVSKVKMELLALDRKEDFDRFLQVLGYWEEDELSFGEVLFEIRLILKDASEEDLLDEFILFLPSDAQEAARLEIAAARLVKEEKIFQKERAN